MKHSVTNEQHYLLSILFEEWTCYHCWDNSKKIICVNKLVKQKSETNELKTEVSVLSYRITQNAKELTPKNLQVYSLDCTIENLQSALYCALTVVWKKWLTKALRSEDT